MCSQSDFGLGEGDAEESGAVVAAAAAGALWLARHRRGAQNALRRAGRRRAWTKDMVCRCRSEKRSRTSDFGVDKSRI